MTHPYLVYKSVPAPSSEVPADFDPSTLGQARKQHLRAISRRNKAMLSKSTYQKLDGSHP